MMKAYLKVAAIAAVCALAAAPEARAYDDNQDWVSQRFTRNSTTTVTTYEDVPQARSRSTQRNRTRNAATIEQPTTRRNTRASRIAASTVTDDVQFERPQRRSSASRRADQVPGFADRSLSGGERGVASYYWQPQRVASGGWFNPEAMTAAHKTLPFGTRVRVTRGDTGQSVVVTINDRGPYIAGRIIDLSRRAAQDIGMTGRGIVPVTVTVLGRS